MMMIETYVLFTKYRKITFS